MPIVVPIEILKYSEYSKCLVFTHLVSDQTWLITPKIPLAHHGIMRDTFKEGMWQTVHHKNNLSIILSCISHLYLTMFGALLERNAQASTQNQVQIKLIFLVILYDELSTCKKLCPLISMHSSTPPKQLRQQVKTTVAAGTRKKIQNTAPSLSCRARQRAPNLRNSWASSVHRRRLLADFSFPKSSCRRRVGERYYNWGLSSNVSGVNFLEQEWQCSNSIAPGILQLPNTNFLLNNLVTSKA